MLVRRVSPRDKLNPIRGLHRRAESRGLVSRLITNRVSRRTSRKRVPRWKGKGRDLPHEARCEKSGGCGDGREAGRKMARGKRKREPIQLADDFNARRVDAGGPARDNLLRDSYPSSLVSVRSARIPARLPFVATRI